MAPETLLDMSQSFDALYWPGPGGCATPFSNVKEGEANLFSVYPNA